MKGGGTESFVMTLYRHLDHTRVQFDLALAEGSECYYEEELRAAGARVLRYPAPGSGSPLALHRALTRLLREQGPYAAVHSEMFLFSGYLLALAHRAGIPVRIAHSHAAVDYRRVHLRRRVFRAAMGGLLRRHATHVFGCSPAALTALLGANWGPDPRVQVIPNPVDLAAYANLPRDRARLREELGLPPAGPLLGFVGRLTPQKNLPFLLSFFAALSQVHPRARLVVAGEGSLRPALEKWRDERGLRDRVQLLGMRHDIPRLMGALDALLLPSVWEGLGTVVLEAQAAGTPCLCSEAVPATVDLGLHLVRRLPTDQGPAPWLSALSLALQTPRPSAEARQERFVATGHDAATLARRMEAVYLGQPPPA
jgi:glycosyltransferase involved in cell wall biosynthesis